MSLSNNFLLPHLYRGLSTPDITPPGSPVPSTRNASACRPVVERESSMSCHDGMVVDDLNASHAVIPSASTTLVTRPMPHPARPPFDTLSSFRHSDMRRLSISMNGLFDVPDTDSLSRSKSGELPVLEHLLSADGGARTLSLGKLIASPRSRGS